MLGWESWPRTCASRWKRWTNCRRRASAGARTLTATVRSREVWVPRYTVAMPPRPMTASMWTSPTTSPGLRPTRSARARSTVAWQWGHVPCAEAPPHGAVRTLPHSVHLMSTQYLPPPGVLAV